MTCVRSLDAISGLAYGFGSVSAPYPPALEQFRGNAPKWTQTHGSEHKVVTRAGESVGDCDALSTRVRGIPIVVATADCVPLILVRRDDLARANAVAAIHAGWRGTLARIGEKTARGLVHACATADDFARWTAVIGPSIGPCCFEVGDDVRADFEREFGTGFIRGKNLDLWGINEAQLRGIGITQIERVDLCTRCARDPSGGFRFNY